jgi:tetratricopeptide (TPR) repeat protein
MKLIERSLVGIITLLIIGGCISPELRTTKIAINERDWNRAMNSADAELVRMPGSVEALFLKGFIYEKMNDWKNMSFWYDSCLRVSPQYKSQIADNRRKLVSRYYTKSIAAYDSSRFEEALTEIDTAIIVDPHDMRLYQQAAATAFYAKHSERASSFALKAIDMETADKRDLTVREVLLIIANEKKDYDGIIKWARELMGMVDPKTDTTKTYQRSLDAMLIAYEAQKNFDAAQKAIEDAIVFFPESKELKHNLALIHLRRADSDNARADSSVAKAEIRAAKEIFKAVLVIDANDLDANLSLGTILVNEDKWTEGIPYLERVRAQDPTNLIAVTNLMAAYYNSGNEKKGDEMKKELDKLKGQ